MRKIIYSLSLLLASFCTATAQTLVTSADELTDGTVISLECRAVSGGARYAFNLNAPKTAPEDFSYANLFKVNKSDDTFKLERLSDGLLVGRNGENVTTINSNARGNAANFTLTTATQAEVGTSDIVEGTEYDKLFRVTTENVHLNTRQTNVTPVYNAGKAAFSVWYVYSYDQAKIDELEAKYNESLGRTHLTQPEQLTDGTIISLECRDYNGGSSYAFNLNATKTVPANFSYNNLFKVISVNGGKITASL